MKFEVEVVDGPQKGQRFILTQGIQLGRTLGQILINDAKVSNKHAKIEKTTEGKLLLVDLKSSNGIKIHGVKVPSLEITRGATFTLGRTSFLVLDQIEEKNVSSASPVEKVIDLRTQLVETIAALSLKNQTPQLQMSPFNPALKLFFVQGVHADESLFLGYGPRKIGSSSLDIELLEMNCPDVAFELLPSPDGPLFKTIHKDIVFLNNNFSEGDLLKTGDLISFGSTLIEVSFEE